MCEVTHGDWLVWLKLLDMRAIQSAAVALIVLRFAAILGMLLTLCGGVCIMLEGDGQAYLWLYTITPPTCPCESWVSAEHLHSSNAAVQRLCRDMHQLSHLRTDTSPQKTSPQNSIEQGIQQPLSHSSCGADHSGCQGFTKPSVSWVIAAMFACRLDTYSVPQGALFDTVNLPHVNASTVQPACPLLGHHQVHQLGAAV